MNSYKKKLTHRIVALALAVAMGSLTPASIYANEKTEMSTTTEVSTTTKMSATTEASTATAMSTATATYPTTETSITTERSTVTETTMTNDTVSSTMTETSTINTSVSDPVSNQPLNKTKEGTPTNSSTDGGTESTSSGSEGANPDDEQEGESVQEGEGDTEDPVDPVIQHKIEVVKTGSGTVLLDGMEVSAKTVDEGTIVNLWIAPQTSESTHHYLKSITINGEALTEFNRDEPTELTLTIDADYELEIIFGNEHTITVEAEPNGVIYLNDQATNQLTVEDGDLTALRVEPNDDYAIQSIQINGEQQEVIDENLFEKTLTVTAHTRISVQYVRLYTVTITKEGVEDGGEIISTPSMKEGVVKVKQGVNAEIEAVPNEGYRVAKIVINRENEAPVIVEFNENNKGHNFLLRKDTDSEVTVYFAPNIYTLTVNVKTGEGGTVTVNSEKCPGKFSVEHGQELVFNMTSKSDYFIQKFNVNGQNKLSELNDVEPVEEDDMPYQTFTHKVTGNFTVEVEFKEGQIINAEGDQLVGEEYKITFHNEDETITDPILRQDNISGQQVVVATRNSTFKIVPLTPKTRVQIPGFTPKSRWLEGDKSIHLTQLILSEGYFGAVTKVNMDLQIVIDEDAPTVNIVPESANADGYYNKDFTVDIDVADPGFFSGIKEVSYVVKNNGVITSGEDPITLYSHLEDAPLISEFKETITIPAEENNSDKITIEVTTTDCAGNTAIVKSEDLKINTVAPQVSVEMTGIAHLEADAGFYSGRQGTITIVDRADTFDAQRATDGVSVKAVDRNGELVEIQPVISVRDWKKVGDAFVNTVVFQEDANYEWEINYTNKAGLSHEQVITTGDHPYQFTVDNTAPTGTISFDDDHIWDRLLQIITFGIWKNESMTAVAKGEDETSEIKSILYYKTDSDQALTTTKLENLFADDQFTAEPFKVNQDETFVIYGRITDRAGNTFYLSTDGTIVDFKKPTVVLEEEGSKSEAGFYKDDIKIKVLVNETTDDEASFSGLRSVDYTVTSDGELTASGNLMTFSETNPSHSDLVENFEDSILISALDNNADRVVVAVTAVDNAGNKTTEQCYLKINVDRPQISIVFDDELQGEAAGTGYFNEPRKAIVEITDRASTFDSEAATAGVNVTAVTPSGTIETPAPVHVGEWTYVPSETEDIYRSVITFPANYHYRWSMSYTNKADNLNEEISDVTGEYPFDFVVDDTAPTGSVKIVENIWDKLLSVITFGLYSPERVTVTCEAEDNISPVTLSYFKTDRVEAMTAEQLANETFVPYEEAFDVNRDEIFVVYVKIVDLASNLTYISSDGFIVDQTKAEVTLTPSEPNENGVYNGDVPVQINVTDGLEGSGIRKVRFWVKVGEKFTQADTLFEFNKEKPKDHELVRDWNGEFIVAGENNSSATQVFVEVLDNAGNQTIKMLTLDIDIAAPQILLRYDNNHGREGYFQDHRTATISIVERKNHFNAKDATEGIKITAVDVNGEKVEFDHLVQISDWTLIEGEIPDLDRHWAKVQFNIDANYTFSISYTDLADNAAGDINVEGQQSPMKFTVDTVPPTGSITAVSAEGRTATWDALISDPTFGFYTSKQIDLSAITADQTAGIASVEYFISDSGRAKSSTELDGITEWKSFDGVTIKPNRQAIVYLKIMDRAGHVTYCSTDGLMLDNLSPRLDYFAPSITLSPSRSSNGIYNGDVVVDVTVEDPVENGVYSGLKTVRYEVSNMNTVTETGTLYSFIGRPTLGNRRRVWQGNLTVSAQLNNSNDVSVRVFAEDNVGNTVWESAPLEIDITAPQISVSYNNNSPDQGSYYNNDRVATITVTERNFDPNNVELTVTNNLGSVPTLSSWQHSAGGGNGDADRHTATLSFAADGDYTFAITCTDLAGNSDTGIQFAAGTANPREFTVDKTNPRISVSYDNNDVQNEHYFAAPRTALISITERNFDPGRVELTLSGTLDGAGVGLPGPSWSSSGDTHTASLNFSADGDYTLEVTLIDQAGNHADPTTYNGAAAQSFTIDQTIEAPQISGVEDGYAYTDEVIPVITYSDRNFASIDVQLLRTRCHEIDVDVTEEYVEIARRSDGGTYTLDAFLRKPEVDGIYKLTAILNDLAGNTVTEEVIFTVNRFGSVYVYGTYLNKLLDQYVQTVENPLVITEYNPNQLVKNSVEVQVSRDGTPLTDVAYSINPTVNDRVEVGESGWYQYEYRVDPENFSDDGIYKMGVVSTDAAGNNPESRASVGSDILFYVDTTPAEMTDIRGLEEPIVNAGEQTVSFDVFDAIGLKQVDVYLDDQAVAQVDQFDNLNLYSGSVVLGEGANQKIHFIVEDLAGNILDTRTPEFQPQYEFNDDITVSTNFFVRWYANKTLFRLSIAGFVIIVAGLFLLLFKKRRKDEDSQATNNVH